MFYLEAESVIWGHRIQGTSTIFGIISAGQDVSVGTDSGTVSVTIN